MIEGSRYFIPPFENKIHIVLRSVDDSYEVTPGVVYPSCYTERIFIEFDNDDNIISVAHHNDFDKDISFNNKQQLIDYIEDNWIEIDDSLDNLVGLLEDMGWNNDR